MAAHFVRMWRPVDLEQIQKHLLLLGDTAADCASCRMLGLNPWTVGKCPQCGTQFQYIASRRINAHPGERFHLIRRLCDQRPDLQMIDYEDYQKAVGAKSAREFFSS